MLCLCWYVSGNGSGHLHREAASLPRSIDLSLSVANLVQLPRHVTSWLASRKQQWLLYIYIYMYIYIYIYIYNNHCCFLEVNQDVTCRGNCTRFATERENSVDRGSDAVQRIVMYSLSLCITLCIVSLSRVVY